MSAGKITASRQERTIFHHMDVVNWRTACQMYGTPVDWPLNHRWRRNWADVTCRYCLEQRPAEQLPLRIGNEFGIAVGVVAGVSPQFPPLTAHALAAVP